MSKVFGNPDSSQGLRLAIAAVVGIVASIVLVLAYVLVSNLMYRIGIEYEIVYIAVGFAIGFIIQKVSASSEYPFAVMAAAFCVLVIIFGDLFTIIPELVSNLGYLGDALVWLFGAYSTGKIGSIFGIIFRISGIGTAFYTARMVK